MTVAGIIVIAILAILVIYVWVAYNGLVRARVSVDSAWAQIDVQLQRRLDLIPNLVETVKGYAAHERGTLDAVIQARGGVAAAVGPAAKAAANDQLSGALNRLLAVAEAYPQLKANENFLSLQEELSGTESRIAFARSHYNETAQFFNAKIAQFPTVLIAKMGTFPAREYFQAEAQAAAAPKVSFEAPPPVTPGA
jgi:LemA protein